VWTTRHHLGAALAALLLTVPILSACAAGVASPTKADPSAPCNGADEQSSAGFYPALEAQLPRAVDGQSLTSVRSGRYCSEKTLGLLETKSGIRELQFAGGALPDPTDSSAGRALIVYHATGLTLDALADAQAAGAGSSEGVSGVTAKRTTIAGRTGIRIDAMVDSGPEVLFFWPASAAGTFDAVTAINEGAVSLEQAVAAFGVAAASPRPG